MKHTVYRSNKQQRRLRPNIKIICIFVVVALLVIGWLFYGKSSTVFRTPADIQYDGSVSASDQKMIGDAIEKQKNVKGAVTISSAVSDSVKNQTAVLHTYAIVSGTYSTNSGVTTADLQKGTVHASQSMDEATRDTIARFLNLTTLNALPDDTKIADDSIVIMPIAEVSPAVKVLRFNSAYYFDNFTKGALFTEASYAGPAAQSLQSVVMSNVPTKETTLKVNMSGVTALARGMMEKLDTVKDPAYFTKDIGAFMADADITHVSNEVSFKEGCAYSRTSFCSPPQMLEVLKNSGVDLVDLSGNHNNDVGKEYNVQTINKYKELGWQTIGGGLNEIEAAKPYIANIKGTKVAFLAYNDADSPGSGTLAGANSAGGNAFSVDKVTADIAAAKKFADFVIVDMQFLECYSYPDGYLEYPQCDGPIKDQAETFKKVIDVGADMVIGTQAHQPQTYEMYNGKPVYYGLGNLFFDQTQWPGTERGIILTHYFVGGKLLQTKLSPTVYGKELQPRLMEGSEATAFLRRLNAAR